MKKGNSSNNKLNKLVDSRLAFMFILILFFFYILGVSQPRDPYGNSSYMKEAQRKLQFFGKYRSFYKKPTLRDNSYLIIKLDSFDFKGQYISSRRGTDFLGFRMIHYGLSIKDSFLMSRTSYELIKELKPSGLVYTTFGDSLLHFERKDGSFYTKRIGTW